MGINRDINNSVLVDFIQDLYGTKKPIHLHEPQFHGNEKDYLNRAIDSTYVSSVGEYISQFEDMISNYSGSKNAVAVVNGTAGLHAALYAAGVGQGDMVITQSLTFVATCNAINMVGADPIFIDVSKKMFSLWRLNSSMSSSALGKLSKSSFASGSCSSKPSNCSSLKNEFSSPISR